MVHADLDAVLVAPLLGELVEPHVVGGHVVAPDQQPKVRALDLGRGLPRGQHVGQREAGASAAGGREEAAATQRGGVGLGQTFMTHRVTSSASGAWQSWDGLMLLRPRVDK